MNNPSTLEIQNRMHGILYMVAAGFFTSLMLAVVRYLSYDFHPFQITFFRNFFALMLFMPWLFKNGLGSVKTNKMPQYTMRALSSMMAMLMWFYVLATVPLAQATALSFTAPLFTTFSAIIFLKERTPVYRWIALIAGVLGTMIILRPGIGEFNYISLFVLFAAVLWSNSSLLMKSLTRTEKPEVIVFYMMAIMTPLSLPPALLHWKWPHGNAWLVLILLGVVSNLSQIMLSRAFSKADLTAVLPFDFLRLIFTSIIAYLAFAEKLDIFTMVGGGIILGSTIYVTYKETSHKRRIRVPKEMSHLE